MASSEVALTRDPLDDAIVDWMVNRLRADWQQIGDALHLTRDVENKAISLLVASGCLTLGFTAEAFRPEKNYVVRLSGRARGVLSNKSPEMKRAFGEATGDQGPVSITWIAWQLTEAGIRLQASLQHGSPKERSDALSLIRSTVVECVVFIYGKRIEPLGVGGATAIAQAVATANVGATTINVEPPPAPIINVNVQIAPPATVPLNDAAGRKSEAKPDAKSLDEALGDMTCAERMTLEMQRVPEDVYLKWSLKDWAARIGFSESMIFKTDAWDLIRSKRRGRRNGMSNRDVVNDEDE